MEGWRWVPLLTNFLGKWVDASTEGMLALGGVFSELGSGMDNGEWFSLEKRNVGGDGK